MANRGGYENLPDNLEEAQQAIVDLFRMQEAHELEKERFASEIQRMGDELLEKERLFHRALDMIENARKALNAVEAPE